MSDETPESALPEFVERPVTVKPERKNRKHYYPGLIETATNGKAIRVPLGADTPKAVTARIRSWLIIRGYRLKYAKEMTDGMVTCWAEPIPPNPADTGSAEPTEAE